MTRQEIINYAYRLRASARNLEIIEFLDSVVKELTKPVVATTIATTVGTTDCPVCRQRRDTKRKAMSKYREKKQ